jgi:hypothetical protein
MPLAHIIGYSQPACFGFRVYKLLLCEGYVLTQRLDPIDAIHVCPTPRSIDNSTPWNIRLLTCLDYLKTFRIHFPALVR